MVNSPNRSAMWRGCQVVGVARSAHTGTSSSTPAMITAPARYHSLGTASTPTQPAWAAVTPPANRRAVLRPAGLERAARSHCPTSATRITTYPSVTTPKSRSSNARGTPAARISAPAIWTSVASR